MLKATNPKDAVGIKKAYLSVLPWAVVYEVGLALLEGALKYGRHNYRVEGVRATTYLDASDRHTKAWSEGQDVDPGSGLSHLTKAIASLMILRDAQRRGMMTDDRPPAEPDPDWMNDMNARAEALVDRYGADAPEAYTQERILRDEEPRTIPFSRGFRLERRLGPLDRRTRPYDRVLSVIGVNRRGGNEGRRPGDREKADRRSLRA